MGKPVNPGGAGGEAHPKAGTTFVQTDPACFRDLVHRLTRPSGNPATTPLKSPAPKPTQNLHEPRNWHKPKIEIKNQPEIQFQPFSQPTSQTILYLESPNGGYRPGPWTCPASPSSIMILSPLSSLQASPVPAGNSNKRASASAMELLNPDEEEEEERAIKEKLFYLHPPPRSKPRLAAEPELLPLFPLRSPNSSTSSNEP